MPNVPGWTTIANTEACFGEVAQTPGLIDQHTLTPVGGFGAVDSVDGLIGAVTVQEALATEWADAGVPVAWRANPNSNLGFPGVAPGFAVLDGVVDYGMDPTDSSDSTVAFNKMMAAAQQIAESNGETGEGPSVACYVRPGTYKFPSITGGINSCLYVPYSGITMFSGAVPSKAGFSATLSFPNAAANSTLNSCIIVAYPPTAGNHILQGGKIQGFTLLGPSASPGNGIMAIALLGTSGHIMEDITIQQFGRGIDYDAGGFSGGYYPSSYNWLRNCEFVMGDNGGIGVAYGLVQGPAPANVDTHHNFTNGLFVDCSNVNNSAPEECGLYIGRCDTLTVDGLYFLDPAYLGGTTGLVIFDYSADSGNNFPSDTRIRRFDPNISNSRGGTILRPIKTIGSPSQANPFYNVIESLIWENSQAIINDTVNVGVIAPWINHTNQLTQAAIPTSGTLYQNVNYCAVMLNVTSNDASTVNCFLNNFQVGQCAHNGTCSFPVPARGDWQVTFTGATPTCTFSAITPIS